MSDKLNFKLLECCETGNLEQIKNLVLEGGDLSFQNNLTLRTAIMNNHLNVVEYLIDKNVSVVSTNNHEIKLAASLPENNILKLLLKSGAVLHKPNFDILVKKVREKDIELIRMFYDSVEQKNKEEVLNMINRSDNKELSYYMERYITSQDLNEKITKELSVKENKIEKKNKI